MRLKRDKMPTGRILALIHENEYVSRQSIAHLNISYNKQNYWIRQMGKENLITKRKLENSKVYTLTDQGKAYLESINPERYPTKETTYHVTTQLERLGKVSEVLAIMKAANYATHPQDKIALGDVTRIQLDPKERAKVMTATHSYGLATDRNEYPKRDTVLGAYYTHKEVKEYLTSGRNPDEPYAVNYSRLAGAFFNEKEAYGLYHTDKTRLLIRMNGESTILLSLGMVITAAFTGRIPDYGIPVLLGRKFTVVNKLLFAKELSFLEHIQQTPENAGIFSLEQFSTQVYYLSCDCPVTPTLLSIMGQTDWEEILPELIMRKYTRKSKGELFDGEEKGLPAYFEAVPNLKRIQRLLETIFVRKIPEIYLICPEEHEENIINLLIRIKLRLTTELYNILNLRRF